MEENNLLKLIAGEMDGINSPEESTELKGYLSNNNSTKGFFSKLKNISLKKTENKSGRELLRKYITLFIGGFAAGIIIFALFFGNAGIFSTGDVSNLTGTLSSREIENIELSNFFTMDLEEVTGRVNLKYHKNIIITEININSAVNIDIAIEYESENLEFYSFRRKSRELTDLVISGNSLRLSNLGDNVYFFLFENKTETDAKMNFKVFNGESLLLEKGIITGRKN